ncbi:long-chain acyl-CoA synthetase [Rivibacter subsaxonicus]|uniref:Long-chain acyl-CoA synthetase n=2 Tax=Rivibacter subsaxonicus TaxID=457575 RepID=A0A4Q7V9K9_9BURK|nr:long-chain acyl-CoA synthetase [Rivibacter subsaxonicus]
MSSVDPAALPLQRLYHWERERADAIWLTQPIGGGRLREINWREGADEVRRVAAHLQAQGWPAGSRIAILGKNSAHWILADLAIWMAGHVSVPLYPMQTAANARQILEHAEAVACFVGKLDDWAGLQPAVAGLATIALPLAPARELAQWDDIVARTAPLAGEPLRAADELATIIYTSGTTGQSKGVMHSFGTITAAVQMGMQRAQLTSEDRILSYLPLAHIAERALVEMGSLASGAHLFFAESLDTFQADLQRARPTVFFSVPRLWTKFQQGVLAKVPQRKLSLLLKLPILGGLVRRKVLAGLGLDQTRMAAGGAAPMPAELLRWWAALGLRITEAYGMTENGGVSQATLEHEFRPGTVGRSYAGVDCRIDPDSGEIQMKSAGLMLGYYKAPELTREAFTADGYLHTGDKGLFEADGNLRIIGRVKDNFKSSKGKYIAPAPIEDKLGRHPAVEACCVVGANLEQAIGLVMLGEAAARETKAPGGREALSASLAAHLQQLNAGLDPHEQLACIVVSDEPWSIEAGFLTPTFKIKRNRIEEAYAARFATWAAGREPVQWMRA